MSNSAIVVFTGKSVETILHDGGSCSWVLDRAHAIRCRYLVCCRSGVDWVEGPEPQGSAFLIGIISDVVPTPDPECPNRWLIKISEFAKADIPHVWQGWRNPVRYTSLESLGIDIDGLVFEPMPEPETVPEDRNSAPIPPKKEGVGPLTISEAKSGLAQAFGVSEEAIEITIRG